MIFNSRINSIITITQRYPLYLAQWPGGRWWRQCWQFMHVRSDASHIPVPPIFSGMLRFLSRVAFFSNLFLIPVLLIHHVPSFGQWDAGLISHMVITAYFIAFPVNVLVYGWLLVTRIAKKHSGIPLWLQVANALFLLLQIYYFQFT